MEKQKLPKHYLAKQKKFKEFFDALENLGNLIKKQGPLDEKTANLIQLAAAAAIRSEGSVHSHTRRAIEAGAKPEEIYHTVILSQLPLAFQPLLLL
jgi:AhpD family alkylhydroperoxidase